MSAGKRRKPRTLLDKLQSEEVFGANESAALRKLHRDLRKRGFLPPYTAIEILWLIYLLGAVVNGAARADARKVQDRMSWMALECAYYKSLGDPQARKKTAGNWGELARTVDRANVRYPYHFERTRERNNQSIEEHRRLFNIARGLHGGPLARTDV